LSVDPINGHVIELLNLALESDTVKWQVGKGAFPGGSEAFDKTMLALRAKYTKHVKEEGKSSQMAKSGSDDEMVVG
jgi:anaphase-promoting complex subunit 6